VGRDRGFTYVEVLVALALLATMAAGIAQLLTMAVRATQSARRQSSTSVLAAQKMEELRALTWGVGADGVPESDTSTDLSVEPATSGGSGLTASPPGSLDVSTPGYVDYLDASGAWVGTGTDVPAGAVFIRRWSVQPLASPSDALVLQVLVSSAVTEPRRRADGTRARQSEDTRLVAIKTRTAR
jgi:prepilin-type N-terminal cleavage/methylation domain-containing protein